MKLELILADRCATCRQTQELWCALSAEHGLAFEVHMLGSARARELMERHGLRTLPALLIDGAVRLVGSPHPDTARKLLRGALGRPPDPAPAA